MSELMELPNILIVSASNIKPKSIIKLITKKDVTELSCGLAKQEWEIDTKYYTANVNLIGMPKSYQRSEEFNKRIEALIIHMDANKLTGLEELKEWEQLLENDCDPEIKLLLSNYCNDDTKITKNRALSWCLDKGFEFIELYPDMEQIKNSTDSTDEEIIPEKFGVDRVIEALEAHTWSNLKMKSKKVISPSKNDSNLSQDELIEDDCTELFSQLHLMRETLHSLPMEERIQCAEQMVSAFWKVLGGDEEELLDI